MLPNLRFPAVLGALLGATALLLGVAGCETKPPDEIAKAVYYGEKPVAMRGSDTFFNGQVAAIVTISRGIGKGYSHPGSNKGGKGHYAMATGPDGLEVEQSTAVKNRLSTLPQGSNGENLAQSGGPNSIPNGPATPGSAQNIPGMGTNETTNNMNVPIGLGQAQMPGSQGMSVPGQSMADEYGQGTEQDADAAKMEQENAMAYLRAKAEIGSPLPPVTLHLNLRNLNGQPIVVEVATFDSDLGNFAVEPGVIKLPPHQLVQPEPMISQLGVTSDVIPVKVTLRLNGQSETHTLMVRSLLNPTDSGGN
jgi:hypothetical protein